MIYLHKEKVLDHMERRYPAEHYVMVDDKPNLLAAMKGTLGARLTTVFVRQGHYALALVFAVLTGFGMMSQVTISNTIIQTTVEADMRGRVISFYALAFFGMQPLGGWLIGFMSKWIGTMNTLLCEGIMALCIGLLHMAFLRRAKMKARIVPQLMRSSQARE